jgi:hypothetical protein
MVLHVLLFTCEKVNILSSLCCGGVQFEFVFSRHSKQQRELFEWLHEGEGVSCFLWLKIV